MLKLLRRVLALALTTLVVAVLGLALAAKLGPFAGYELYAVRSGSMSPAIRVGDLVLEERVDPNVIRPGDVITVSMANGAIVTHRVVTATQNDAGPYFATKGDANPKPDPTASMSGQVRGRVAWAVPRLGFLLALATMPSGVLALFAIGGSLLVAIWLLEELEDREAIDDLTELHRILGAGGAPAT